MKDAEGYELVNADGGDLGRAGPTGRALKHMTDGRWLLCLEASSKEELVQKVKDAPKGGRHFADDPTPWPIYSSVTGGLTHCFITYLFYKEKPE